MQVAWEGGRQEGGRQEDRRSSGVWKRHRRAKVKSRFRLKGTADFQRLRRLGKVVRHPLLVMVILPNQLEFSRIGVVAGRAVGKAVQRNRAKRILRHAIEPHLAMLPVGWDILFIARKPILAATFPQIQDTLSSLLRRSNLLLEKNELDVR